jgi:broad specificity phosphatase PhoE
MSRAVLLVRHPPVRASVHGVCYGWTDVSAEPGDIEPVFAGDPITHVVHSGLVRCSKLAAAIADRAGVPATVDPRWRERHFGAWEGRRWDDIHAETGDAMMGMVTHPETWRPPGGETTFELRDRVLAAFANLPPDGRIVVVTHGGPIAVLLGTRAGKPVAEWPSLIPACGTVTAFAGGSTMTRPIPEES